MRSPSGARRRVGGAREVQAEEEGEALHLLEFQCISCWGRTKLQSSP
jgi:hypothetical protein